MKSETKPNPPAMGQIVLRLPMAKKTSYVRAAKPGRLAEWCIKVLDEAERGCELHTR